MVRIRNCFLLTVLGFSICTVQASIAIIDSFDTYPLEKWTEGSVHGNWRDVFNGYGYQAIVRTGNNRLLEQSPKPSDTPGETHASLSVTKAGLSDFKGSVTGKTIKQLRRNTSPNVWETGWVIWHYTDNQHFYYFVCKPNGWELGKEDPNYSGSQRFLATGASPSCAVGTSHQYGIKQTGATISVSLDNKAITSYTDNERPYPSGAFGLYNEDAQVQWDQVSITSSQTGHDYPIRLSP